MESLFNFKTLKFILQLYVFFFFFLFFFLVLQETQTGSL